jgi:hypothetical protein
MDQIMDYRHCNMKSDILRSCLENWVHTTISSGKTFQFSASEPTETKHANTLTSFTFETIKDFLISCIETQQ